MKMEPVEHMFVKVGLLYMFKIVHNYAEKPRFFPAFSLSSTRGHGFKLYVEYSRFNVRKNVFFLKLIKIWNALPSHVVEQASISSFKKYMYTSDFVALLSLVDAWFSVLSAAWCSA